MNNFTTVLKVVGLVAILGVIGVGIAYWPQIRGVLPAIQKPNQDIVEIIENNNSPVPAENTTGFPLKLPDGMKIEVLAKDLPGARVLAFDGQGNLWVSQTSQGAVTRLGLAAGNVVSQDQVLRGLTRPHGLALDPADSSVMYVAEEGKISRLVLNSGSGLEKIADLPTRGGGHFTRTIEFGPDGRLYVSIGSSCNVCQEDDPRRAAIYSMNKDGSDFKPVATGLRNSVFFDWAETDGSMWATENSRDNLGDNLPPDELNRIAAGGDYGWPVCYGQNVHDTNFDKNVYIQNPCNGKVPAAVEIQAHSAPLGLDFIPEEGWPQDYWYDAIVALHGSWNRTEPTGYKLIRIKFNAQGEYEGTEDLISGWLQGSNALGRPVDVLAQPGGIMYVSDDKAGVVYRITVSQ